MGTPWSARLVAGWEGWYNRQSICARLMAGWEGWCTRHSVGCKTRGWVVRLVGCGGLPRVEIGGTLACCPAVQEARGATGLLIHGGAPGPMVPWDWRMLTGWEAGHALLWGVGPLLWGDGPLLWGSPFRLQADGFQGCIYHLCGKGRSLELWQPQGNISALRGKHDTFYSLARMTHAMLGASITPGGLVWIWGMARDD